MLDQVNYVVNSKVTIPDHVRRDQPTKSFLNKQAHKVRKYNDQAMRNIELLLHQNTVQYHLSSGGDKIYRK